MKYVSDHLLLVVQTNTRLRVINGKLHVIEAPNLKRAAVKELLVAGPQIVDLLNHLFGLEVSAPTTMDLQLQPTDSDLERRIGHVVETPERWHAEATGPDGECGECAWVGSFKPGSREHRMFRRHMAEQARRHARVADLRLWTEVPPGPPQEDETAGCARCGCHGFLNRDGSVVGCEWCSSEEVS